MTGYMDMTVKILLDAESFVVPVKWVLGELKKNTPSLKITISQLTEKFKKDERFKLFAEHKMRFDGEKPTVVSDEEMENLGFYRGPQVMLKSRIPTQREVVDFLLGKADQTFKTLKKAWEIRPEGDKETEDKLLEALAKAQRLQRELRMVLSREQKKKSP